MAIIDTNRPNVLANGAQLTSVFSALVATFSAWNDRRSTSKSLSKLSDRELDDIGLNRGDVYSITH